jgi:hypothetical protein
MRPTGLLMGKDAEPGGLGAFRDFSEHAERALVGLDGLGS